MEVGEAAEAPFELLEPADQHARILVAGQSGAGSVDVLLGARSVAQVQADGCQADVDIGLQPPGPAEQPADATRSRNCCLGPVEVTVMGEDACAGDEGDAARERVIERFLRRQCRRFLRRLPGG